MGSNCTCSERARRPNDERSNSPQGKPMFFDDVSFDIKRTMDYDTSDITYTHRNAKEEVTLLNYFDLKPWTERKIFENFKNKYYI